MLNDTALSKKGPIIKPAKCKGEIPKKKPPKQLESTISNISKREYIFINLKPLKVSPSTVTQVDVSMLPNNLLDALSKFIDNYSKIALSWAYNFDSVYDSNSITQYFNYFEQATKKDTVDLWFKKNSDPVNMSVKKNVAFDKRLSLVPKQFGQRFGILIHALKKYLGTSKSLLDLLKCVLSFQLSKDLFSLLSESLVDVYNEPELITAARNISIAEKKGNNLYEDEIFLYFLYCVPKLKNQMRALYIIESFDTHSNSLKSRLDCINDCIESIVCNPQINLIFQILLKLQNICYNENNDDFKCLNLQNLHKVGETKINNNVTLYDYLSMFTPNVLTNTQIKLLQTAASYNVSSTYTAVKDLIQTYLMLESESPSCYNSPSSTGRSNEHKVNSDYAFYDVNPNKSELFGLDMELNEMIDKSYNKFNDIVKQKLVLAQPTFVELLKTYWKFCSLYLMACFYYGDPKNLLGINDFNLPLLQQILDHNDHHDLISKVTAFLFGIMKQKVFSEANKKTSSDAVDIHKKQDYDVTVIDDFINNVLGLKNKYHQNNPAIPIFTTNTNEHSIPRPVPKILSNNQETRNYSKPQYIRRRFGLRPWVKKVAPSFPPIKQNRRSSIDSAYNLARTNN